MNKCNLCKNSSSNSFLCHACGYASSSNTLKKELFGVYYRSLKGRTYHWSKRIKLLGRLELLLKYSQSKIARMLNCSKATISNNIKLAHALKKTPDLERFTSTKKALAHSDEPLKRVYRSENELQNYLYKNWTETQFSKKWSLVKSTAPQGKYSTGEMGEMDFLAQTNDLNQWLIIELKQDQTSDVVVGQILRYMGWIKKNKAKENDKIHGLIICGDINRELKSALVCVPFIEAYIYRIEDNDVKFMTYEEAKKYDAIELLKSLSPEKQKKCIEKLNRDR